MIKELNSLGYREMTKGVYGKPVAMNLFTFEIKNLTWTNWFKGGNDGVESFVWHHAVYDKTKDENFLIFIKDSEAATRLSRTFSEYEFLTKKEEYSFL